MWLDLQKAIETIRSNYLFLLALLPICNVVSGQDPGKFPTVYNGTVKDRVQHWGREREPRGSVDGDEQPKSYVHLDIFTINLTLQNPRTRASVIANGETKDIWDRNGGVIESGGVLIPYETPKLTFAHIIQNGNPLDPKVGRPNLPEVLTTSGWHDYFYHPDRAQKYIKSPARNVLKLGRDFSYGLVNKLGDRLLYVDVELLYHGDTTDDVEPVNQDLTCSIWKVDETKVAGGHWVKVNSSIGLGEGKIYSGYIDSNYAIPVRIAENADEYFFRRALDRKRVVRVRFEFREVAPVEAEIVWDDVFAPPKDDGNADPPPDNNSPTMPGM